MRLSHIIVSEFQVTYAVRTGSHRQHHTGSGDAFTELKLRTALTAVIGKSIIVKLLGR